MALISIKEYAERNGLQHDNIRHKCLRGGFKTARKIGRDWVISENEVNIDHRIGKRVSSRKKTAQDPKKH